MNERLSEDSINKRDFDNINTKSQDGGVINDSLYNKLLHLAEQRPRSHMKTKKIRKKRKNKTRKI